MAKQKRETFVLDTEDDSCGKLYHINFYNGEKHWSFRDTDTAIQFLENYSLPVTCWAVNLEYDIINLFRDRFSKIRWNFGRTSLVSAQFGKWLFYDTLRHWKMSVRDMGTFIGLPKMEFDPNNLEYCRRDCEVTFNFVSRMSEIYGRIGIPIKSTLPSSVYQFWLKNYCRKRLPILGKRMLDTFRRSYYGGRTECFFIGNWNAPVHVVDVNSLYPYVMQSEYPAYSRIEKRFHLNGFGVTYCEVEVKKTDIPPLPYRTETGKLIYPIGRFRGSWANHELNYAVQTGFAKIKKVFNSFCFPVSCFPFKDFVSDFFNRRKNSDSDLMRMTYKIAMNSLYGKFGQGNEKTVVTTFSKWLNSRKGLDSDQIQQYGDLIIYKKEGDYPLNTNMIWALYTTAYARIYLHKAMMKVMARGGRVLYCDTDSIVFSGEKDLVDTSGHLGAFKDEGTYPNAHFKLPKLYRLGDKIRAKGVPLKNQNEFFDWGTVEFMKPVKFKESLRRGIKANVWMPHTKAIRSSYDKGIIVADGFVRPLKLSI